MQNQHYEIRKVEELVPYSKNNEFFRDLDGEDFKDLINSIKQHGIIEPIVIKPDNTILCGHQRWRAAKEVGLTEVPVIVREVATPEEEESILIEENLRRRQLSTSEMAKAIKRLYEIYGIERSGGKPCTECTVRKDIAESTGYKERQVATLRTLADLIPELSKLLDEKKITQKVAYQLAQLSEEEQKAVLQALTTERIINLSEKEAKEIKKQFQSELEEKNKKIKEYEEKLKETLGELALKEQGLKDALYLLEDQEDKLKRELDARKEELEKKYQADQELLERKINYLEKKLKTDVARARKEAEERLRKEYDRTIRQEIENELRQKISEKEEEFKASIQAIQKEKKQIEKDFNAELKRIKKDYEKNLEQAREEVRKEKEELEATINRLQDKIQDLQKRYESELEEKSNQVKQMEEKLKEQERILKEKDKEIRFKDMDIRKYKKEASEWKDIAKEKEKGISKLVYEKAQLEQVLGDEKVKFILIEFGRFLDTYRERAQKVREAILYLPGESRRHLAARLQGVISDSQDLRKLCLEEKEVIEVQESNTHVVNPSSMPA